LKRGLIVPGAKAKVQQEREPSVLSQRRVAHVRCAVLTWPHRRPELKLARFLRYSFITTDPAGGVTLASPPTMTVHFVSVVCAWLFVSIPVSLLIGACIGATPDREAEIVTPLSIPMDEAA
jgi:hypothetical protein